MKRVGSGVGAGFVRDVCVTFDLCGWTTDLRV